ncbi:MAG TPA: cytochrome c oxidase subunit 3 [Candidatus Angelobacter sp.]|nr:cytochrome c oxidase subunit 3 [Candidatus Angelobacter sp.]
MPIIGDRVEIEHKPKLGGGGPGKTPHRRGFGGGDDGDHGGPENFQSREQRMRRYRIAMTLGIISVTILFMTLIALYVFRQGRGRFDEDTRRWVQDWVPLTLPYLQLWINSAILLLSSLTLELTRRTMTQKDEFAVMGIVPPRRATDVPWLAITVLLGCCFLGGQFLVWNNLQHQGVFLESNPSRSFFYILTGTHAIHLLGGLLVLFYAAAGKLLAVRFESQKIAVEVTGWYWHYMAFLWFGIFALVHFVK